jgi:hypothetical protein
MSRAWLILAITEEEDVTEEDDEGKPDDVAASRVYTVIIVTADTAYDFHRTLF